MATSPWLREGSQRLAVQTREHYLNGVRPLLDKIGDAVQQHLRTLREQPGNARDMRERRDAWMLFEEKRGPWLDATAQVLRRMARSPTEPVPTPSKSNELSFELVGTDVIENRIVASRISVAVMEDVKPEFDDLRVRMEYLEGHELPVRDMLQPEVVTLTLIEQWGTVELPRGALQAVTELIQKTLAEQLLRLLHECNEFLIAQNVMPRIEMQQRLRRGTAGGRSPPRSAPPVDAIDSMKDKGGDVPGRATSFERSAPGVDRGAPSAVGAAPSALARGSGGMIEETRMMTGTTPLARARMRAQGIFGQLKRLLSNQVGDFEKTALQPPSPALAQALQPSYRLQHGAEAAILGPGSTLIDDYTPAGIARVAGALREQTTELKKKASTDTEKATIEVVALMFQSILAEERIPPAIRVWFARLQLPVLRVALAEPEFFSSMNHPARLLIDRMGSCVMGFDAQSISGSALEAEIKRSVQVIEQYPETGGRVFQLVHDEFQAFLSKFLTEKEVTRKVVSIAQQVEKRETLAIQYTIEMRSLLADMPVPETIRDFLFKVWAEVLALAAIRQGPRHEQTLSLKSIAPELVWAASAKPNRADRARVIQELPQMLQRLRQGMTMLGLEQEAQDGHVKLVSDILAAAFLSKGQPIPPARIDAMARRLANLEDFASDKGLGDLPLDAESLLPMLGIDASALQIVSAGGSRPNEAMIAWALELQPGHWFTLEHNGAVQRVQFAWRSQRKQLYLFAAIGGLSYLFQRRRLASYLQAGLLLPQEEEALTLRATRTAIAKLDANPERLLH